ncbi:hypothetical protein EUTSA_v10024160mg [Eutrema salsugineum]|uniref:Uncharacterized protein n=1 Tax=Eutrema salsugineum TaxID=72664 RepID=V4KQL6_EUTSA|nr:uncharacterized protein LOC18009960 [Eutrema salsugineum]ESQ29638.1 hypothetical protein EUTSA_v10024160mg [Eutrema salsugineum]
MNDSRSDSERSVRTWSIYTTKDGSGSSMNAISFGFVATAILISMFLIMAIFEHLFRPDQSSSLDGSAQCQKLAEHASKVPVTTSDVSVMMPGEKLPSHIALPAPFSCQIEGICWPSHL